MLLLAASLSWEQGRRTEAEESLDACMVTNDNIGDYCHLERSALHQCASLLPETPIVAGGMVFIPDGHGLYHGHLLCDDMDSGL